MATLFVSDLHLDPARPEITRLFAEFLDGEARSADALYILGDLFEAWVGDDDPSEIGASVADRLAALAASGVPVYFMHGNRDFLLGADYARRAGMVLLEDPTVVDLHGRRALLMHGDTLCTDDDAYQAFRAEVRAPEWRQAFLSLPLSRRKQRIEALRRESEAEKRVKPLDIMDVNPGAVLRALTFHRCPRLIHGHTHRPARHRLIADGVPSERWVLPDWDATGGYLSCDAAGCSLLDWPTR